ncbi:MAG: tyrosine-type recombinase/integrase [Anaerolineae bacterium]
MPDEAAPPLLFDLIDQFVQELRRQAGTPSALSTARSYAFALRTFKRFVKTSYSRKRQTKAPYPAGMLADDVLVEYRRWLLNTAPKPQPDAGAESASGFAVSTARHYLAALKRFLTWAVAENRLPGFDLGRARVRLENAQGQARHAYRHRQIDRGLPAVVVYYDNLPLPAVDPDMNGRERWKVRQERLALLRARGILHVLYDTGLRVSELTAMQREVIDDALRTSPLPEDAAVQITGKGGRTRTVWLTRQTLGHLRAYLRERNDSFAPLFIAHSRNKGQPVTRQWVWKVVKDGAKAAGVARFSGPHAFRHWFAQQLFNDEEHPVAIEDVQELLGHASPVTTRVVYAPKSKAARLHQALKRARKPPEEALGSEESGQNDSGES